MSGEPYPARLLVKSHQIATEKERIKWKHDRPNRPDPYKASGWNTHFREKLKTDDDDFFDSIMEDKSEAYKGSVALYHKLEQEQEEEDTTMLIRLVKIRHHLWT